ncbi:MAG: hypothetical protein H0X66_22225 [Verrucomicrobia bacterium]|nr:hypothetical protein [Verrucomicrobiota bacterium]
MADANSTFYGTTYYGGAHDLGAVFKWTSANGKEVLHGFRGAVDGAHPGSALLLLDGFLYGTTQFGGASNAGTVFKISAAGDFTMLREFPGGGQGEEPIAALVAGPDGVLYGTTSRGGTHGMGTIFQITTNGAFTTLFNFAGSNGNSPVARLVFGEDGNLYGTTQYGGESDNGTVFKITTGGAFTSMFSFNGVNGSVPESALIQAPDGAFFGTTTYGGTHGFGILFKILANGTFNGFYSMRQGEIGTNPSGGLILGTDGKLYGSAMHGGVHGFGSIFRTTINGDVTSQYNFTGDDDGGNPATGLWLGSNAAYYGTTGLGGAGHGGTFYKLTVAPRFTTVQLSANGQQVQYSGDNGAPNGPYTILTSTDLAAPLVDWNFVGTNSFDGAGEFTFSIGVNENLPKRFYLLITP